MEKIRRVSSASQGESEDLEALRERQVRREREFQELAFERKEREFNGKMAELDLGSDPEDRPPPVSRAKRTIPDFFPRSKEGQYIQDWELHEVREATREKKDAKKKELDERMERARAAKVTARDVLEFLQEYSERVYAENQEVYAWLDDLHRKVDHVAGTQDFHSALMENIHEALVDDDQNTVDSDDEERAARVGFPEEVLERGPLPKD
jgi:hypothetical protein